MQWDEFELPSNRKFGIFLALVCGALAVYLAFRSRTVGASAAGVAALAAGLVAWLEPEALRLLNKAWNRLGLVLASVINPIAMGILFLGLFTPLAVVLRLAGRDELRLRRVPAGASYWRLRHPPGPPPGSFGRQF
jgi:hypothetical protein